MIGTLMTATGVLPKRPESKTSSPSPTLLSRSYVGAWRAAARSQ